jgi:MarR family transcriptional regulator, lower aerobic nicotinate degradation pathway regulator
VPAEPRVPATLRQLVSWQAGRLATLSSRLTGRRLPLEARSDFAVLATLDELGPSSQADLGRLLGLDRNNVNGIVTRLESHAQISRRTDPADRRRNVVTITAAGRERFAVLQQHAAAVQAELLGALSEQEAEQLVALLEKVLADHPAQPA